MFRRIYWRPTNLPPSAVHATQVFNFLSNNLSAGNAEEYPNKSKSKSTRPSPSFIPPQPTRCDAPSLLAVRLSRSVGPLNFLRGLFWMDDRHTLSSNIFLGELEWISILKAAASLYATSWRKICTAEFSSTYPLPLPDKKDWKEPWKNKYRPDINTESSQFWLFRIRLLSKKCNSANVHSQKKWRA